MGSKLFFILILILAGIGIFGMVAKPSQTMPSQYITQTKPMGAVDVRITPVSLVAGQPMVFKLAVDTHSVELDYNWLEVASLKDNSGNTLKPSEWTGGNSGHHLSGNLIFPKAKKPPKELTLTLTGIDNQIETFIWQF